MCSRSSVNAANEVEQGKIMMVQTDAESSIRRILRNDQRMATVKHSK